MERLILLISFHRPFPNVECKVHSFLRALLLTFEALIDTLQVSGDIRAVFYDKSGGHLFNVCFNTFFISNSMLQFNRGELDKLGRRGKTVCGPGFCLELLFGPVEPQVPSPQGRNLEDSVELL
jgi:hypothetical protein